MNHIKLRKEIKELLSILPERHQLMFKRMYSFDNMERTIEEIVDIIPDKSIEWAYQQVLNTHLAYL